MSNEPYKQTFDYLVKISGGKLFLNTKQLEQVTGILVKQQSVLRLNKELPIAYKTIGRIIYYSINDVVNYLLSGSITNKENLSIIVHKEQSKSLLINKKANNKDLSHLFNLSFLANKIGVEIANLNNLKDNLEIIIKTTDLCYKINNSLNSKEVKKRVIKE